MFRRKTPTGQLYIQSEEEAAYSSSFFAVDYNMRIRFCACLIKVNRKIFTTLQKLYILFTKNRLLNVFERGIM